ncbi:hypothetical protein [Paraburkholderia sp.]|uniref:hypothetical protein n=1 Tax=Paraburkholderia sp. TaxID=1926495 RepID=UPI0039E2B744
MSLMKSKKAALKPKEKTVKPRPGTNRIVVLPGWRKGEEQVFFHEWGQHFIKNAAGEIQAVIPCAEATFGKPCSACESLNRAMRVTEDDETVELLKGAKSKQGFVLNALDLDGPTKDDPVIYELGKSAFTQLVDTIEEWGEKIFDAEKPQIIVIQRDGKGLNTKYTVQPSPKGYDLPAGTLSKLHNLDEYVAQENEEQTRRALSAISTVAGLLPAPTASADKPKSLDAVGLDGDDELREVEMRGAAVDGTPSGASVSLNEELDDLLGDLEATGT